MVFFQTREGGSQSKNVWFGSANKVWPKLSATVKLGWFRNRPCKDVSAMVHDVPTSDGSHASGTLAFSQRTLRFSGLSSGLETSSMMVIETE